MQNEKYNNNRYKKRVEARKKIFLSVKRKVGRQHQQQLGSHADINSASSEEKNIILNERIAFYYKCDVIRCRTYTLIMYSLFHL